MPIYAPAVPWHSLKLIPSELDVKIVSVKLEPVVEEAQASLTPEVMLEGA
jgi:hypothetical protein